MNETPAPRFTGWLRLPGGRWQPVASADDALAARDRLNAVAMAYSVADLYVGPAGTNPNQRLDRTNRTPKKRRVRPHKPHT